MIRIIKIGGRIIDEEQALDSFCKDFASIEGPKVLVHGGGSTANHLLTSMGHPSRKVEGRRVTDAGTLEIVTMLYAGWCNKHISALLQKHGCNAIGLSGCDADSIRSQRRAPRILSDGVTVVDYGFVGDVTAASINVELINKLLGMGLTPVFSAINHDGQGQLLNTNADTVAASLAAALGGELVLCFEKKGVLSDVEDDESVIPQIDKDGFEALKAQGKVSDGMLPKLENAFNSLAGGCVSVRITSPDGILSTQGTKISL